MRGKCRDFILFAFFICLLSFVSVVVPHTLDRKSDSTSLSLKPNEEKEQDFARLIKKNLQYLKELDYYESEGLSIDLPGNKIFKIHWKDKGSGNILSPFEAIEAVIEDLDDQVPAEGKKEEDSDKFSLEDLAKLFIKTKIKKSLHHFYSNYKELLGGWGWLIKPKLSPVDVFAIKLVLLMLHDYQGQEIKRKIEILRLLFRLSQSKVFNLLDKKDSVFSYLPKDIAEKLRNHISQEWQLFIDKMWQGLTEGLNNNKFSQDGQFDKSKIGVEACGFVFDDPFEAQVCFEKLSNRKDYNCFDFQNEIEKSVAWHYNSYKNFNDFGRVNEDTQLDYLPEKVKHEILSVIDFPKIKLINVSDDESWIIFISDKLSLFETVKLLFVSLLKSFEEYKDIKKENQSLGKENEVEPGHSEEQQKILTKIEQLETKSKDLKVKLDYALSKAKNAYSELEEKKKKAGSSLSKLSKALIKKAEKKYQKEAEKSADLKNAFEMVEKEIKQLKQTPEYFLSDYDVTYSEEKGIWYWIVEAFVNSPELKKVFADINCVEKYKVVKRKLYQRIAYILKNSQNVKENFELWSYILTSISSDLTSVMNDLQEEMETSNFYDSILNSVLGL